MPDIVFHDEAPSACERFHTRPMSWARIEEKFHPLASAVLAPGRREAIISAVKRLDEIRVRELMTLSS